MSRLPSTERRTGNIVLAATVVLALVIPASPSAANQDPVIGTAGDIACAPTDPDFNDRHGTPTTCRQKYTSALLVNRGLARVLPLGDNQYEDGTLAEFQGSYDFSWGRVKAISSPVAGNHEYQTLGAAGYFDYFDGPAALTGPAGDRDKGYYSYDVGRWHLVALNSECAQIGGCDTGSAQEVWLKADLAANPAKCTLAYWHRPLFNSGFTGNRPEMKQIWQDLYDARADVVLNGHSHTYERFAPQDPNGVFDRSRGIREFVVGTGGEDHHRDNIQLQPNSRVINADTFGILKLTLHRDSYRWRFVPEAGGLFTDSGSASCH